MGAGIGLHHLGNPRANAPSGQLQSTSEHHHPVPVQLLILHRGQRLVVSGHSQSLQLTGLYIPPIDLPTATKAQLQEEGVLSPHKGCTSSTQVGWLGRLCHWTLQDTIYIRPCFQNMFLNVEISGVIYFLINENQPMTLDIHFLCLNDSNNLHLFIVYCMFDTVWFMCINSFNPMN